MRKYGFFFAGAAILGLSAVLVDGLQGQPKGGGGGGGGGGNVLTLVNNKDVKKELNITDEQAAKIPAEVLAALGKVLDEKQLKRLKQIQVQQMGNNAFKDAGVQKELNLTAEQKTSIDGILEVQTKELAEFKGGFGGFGKGKGGADIRRRELRQEERSEQRQVIGLLCTKTDEALGRGTPNPGVRITQGLVESLRETIRLIGEQVQSADDGARFADQAGDAEALDRHRERHRIARQALPDAAFAAIAQVRPEVIRAHRQVIVENP